MKRLKYLMYLSLLTFASMVLQSCIINNPTPEECDVLEIVVTEIYEGASFDIVFKDAGKDYFNINRGIERGLTVEGLKQQVLNKNVTLHLPKIGGFIQSEHIAQLAIKDSIIFTEFK